jgi:hypothetical protein
MPASPLSNCNLDAAEYDFSIITSKSELNACLVYEYARESREVESKVKSVRRQSNRKDRKTVQLKFGCRVQNPVQSHIITTLSLVSGFPITPWTRLSENDKDVMQKMIYATKDVLLYHTTANNPPLAFATAEPGTRTLEAWLNQHQQRMPHDSKGDPIKYGFFAVNLKYGHVLLIQEFAKYLRAFEGKPMLEWPKPLEANSTRRKPPGRKSTHDWLNALGALRLRYHCKTFSDAKKLMNPLKDKPCGLYYARRDGFNRACRAATDHFKLIFGWLDLNKPFHFTEGWGDSEKKRHY